MPLSGSLSIPTTAPQSSIQSPARRHGLSSSRSTRRIVQQISYFSANSFTPSPITISNFVEDIYSIVQKLDAIGHKPTDLEVSDKILIGLDPSWGPVCTTLMLQLKTLTIEEITSALKQYEANESSSELAVKKEAGEASLLARDKRSRGKKNERNHDENEAEEIDWGNSKGREGVCFRCGRHRHCQKNPKAVTTCDNACKYR